MCFKGDNSQRLPAADEQPEEINGNESVVWIYSKKFLIISKIVEN